MLLLGAVAAGVAVYLFLVPIDLSGYRDNIAKRIEDFTGTSMVSESITLRVLPVPYIEVKGLRLFEEDREVLSAGDMRFKVSPLPLFLKKVVLKKVRLTDWTLTAERDKGGGIKVYNIYERIIRRKHVVTVSSLEMAEGRISARDLAGGRDVSFDITVDRAELRRTGRGVKFMVNAGVGPEARLFLNGTGGKVDDRTVIKGTASLTDFGIGWLNEYIQTEGLKIKGRVSTKISYSSGAGHLLSGLFNYKDLHVDWPVRFKKPILSSSGSSTIRLASMGKTLQLSMGKFNSEFEEFDIKGRAGVTVPLEDKDKTTVELAVSSTPMAVKKAREFMPAGVFSQKTARTIKGFKTYDGNITIDEFTLKAGLKEILERTIFKKPGFIALKVGLDGLNFRYPGVKGRFSRITGGVILKDATLLFEDITGRYNSGEVINFNGALTDIYTTPEYKIAMKLNLEAGETLRIVKGLYKIKSGATRKKLDMTDTQGITRIAIGLNGDLHGRRPTVYSGTMKFTGLKLRYPDVPVFFDSATGEITFDNNSIGFKKIFIRDAANSTYKLTGRIKDYKDKRPFIDLKVGGGLKRGTLLPFIEGTSLEHVVFEDGFSYTMLIKGKSSNLLFTPSIDLTATSVRYKKLVKKPRDFPVTLNGKVMLKNSGFDIEKAVLKVGTSDIHSSGHFGNDLKSYRFTLESKVIKLSDIGSLTPFLKRDASNAGLLTVDMMVYKDKGAQKPGYRGWLRLKKGILTPFFAASPFKDIVFSAKFRGDSADVNLARLKAGKSEIKGAAHFTSISGRVMDFEVDSRALYLEDFWEKKTAPFKDWVKEIMELDFMKGKEVPEKSAPVKRPLTGNGTVRIAGGSAFGQPFKDFSMKVDLGEKAVHMKPVSLITNGGTVGAESTFYRSPDSDILYDVKADISGVRLKTFLSSLGVKDAVISGTLNGKIFLACKRNAKPLARGVDGEVHLQAERGKLWKFLFLGKVFSVVNIISLDELFKKGLPYRMISGDFKVEKGVITTNNLFFDSDSVRMSSAGNLDTAERTIDVVLVLHPFVTIDKIITSIPVAGWIIGGKDKSAVNVYYSIKGPVKDPSVKPAPVKSIQEAVLGKLQRLLEAPFKMIKEGSEVIMQNGEKKAGPDNTIEGEEGNGKSDGGVLEQNKGPVVP